MNKIIAVYLGPSGLAMVGQFQNFVGIVSGVSNGSIQTGILKYVAEYKDDLTIFKRIIKNSLIISLFLSVLVSILLFIFSYYFSRKVMFSTEYVNFFYFLAFSMIFYSLNLYILSVLNGLGKIRLFTFINILISIFSLITTTILTMRYSLKGALFSIVLVQSLVFIISFILVSKKLNINLFPILELKSSLDLKTIQNLLKYSFVSFSLGALASIMQIFLRSLIEKKMCLTAAGIWEGGWRMMLYFNMLFILPFSVYYLPKFSEASDSIKIHSYLMEAYKFLAPLIILVAIIISLLRKFLIKVLFSVDFFEITKILPYMLLAEIIRIFGNTLANVFLAKTKVATIIKIEFIFVFSMLSLSYFLIKPYGLSGVAWAYILASSIFFFSYLYIYRKETRVK